MAQNQTKVCSMCGKELPLEMFGKGHGKDGKQTRCKNCMNALQRNYRLKRKIGEEVPNPALAEFTPQELITELRVRGYRGELSFQEVKIHKIKI